MRGINPLERPSRDIVLLVFFALFLAAATSGAAAGGADAIAGVWPNVIIGVWLTQERDAKIDIYRCQDKYCGKIVWTKDEPRLDVKNPDPALRGRPISGLRIMKGFHFAGKNEWAGGRLYDPKSGHTYKGTMTLVSPERLRLRGYFLIPLFGRTAIWSRIKDQNERGQMRR
ncbi:MAG: DUF2147 domain-containing protein [Nitrospiraceae bacterium]|nr:DUF2147 domain-containing protein [Nitrospiraceae bacterium]